MKFLGKLLRFFLLLAIAVGLIALGYYFAVTNNVELHPEKLLLSEERIMVYDANACQLKSTTFSTQKQTVPLSDIPEITQNAFICTEDQRFFQHHGFDLKRICGAVLHNLRSFSFKEGASTISQQLIKNTHLSQEKTLKRKLQEWKLTRILEKKYTKAEILETYLNSIYFGHDCFGIGAASEFYFGKSTKNLTLAESAMLAGLVKSPNNYSPFRHPERCIQRRATVLSIMKKIGNITQKEYKSACATPLPTEANQKSDRYLPFVFDELSALSEANLFHLGGQIEIYTYLDSYLQKNVEKIATQVKDCETQILILDQKTGGYKAAYYSLGSAKRLPGSLIKPLLVYAPALEEDLLSPATPILDEKVTYGDYCPENYGKKYHGYTSLRTCVEKSLNIPAVKTLVSLGISKGTAYLEKLGLDVPQEDHSLALALGGMKAGFSLQQLTEAYSVFPSGTKINGGFIKEIKIDGISVYKHKQKQTRVFSEESAFLMTDMLKSAAKNGTAKKLRSLPFDIAAKTGTVGNKNGNTDSYTIAFTNNDVVSVWLGNKDNRLIQHTGGELPCALTRDIHEYLYALYKEQGTSIERFRIPNQVVCVALDKLAYNHAHSVELADTSAPTLYSFNEYFKKNNLPKTQSKTFSSPCIPTPTAIFEYGKVKLIFPKNCPSFYQYQIERYDYVKHSTLYIGDYLDCYIDADILPNKKYIYTITPIYREHIGIPIELPAISTAIHESKENPITEKDWWDY